jgi:hypothetical protein
MELDHYQHLASPSKGRCLDISLHVDYKRFISLNEDAAARVLVMVERDAVPADGATHSVPGRLRENARPAR